LRTWLIQKRNEKNLTQEETAKLSSISRSYYTHIEKGTKTPTVKVAQRIANTLGFDWTIFFENNCSLKEQNKSEEVS